MKKFIIPAFVLVLAVVFYAFYPQKSSNPPSDMPDFDSDSSAFNDVENEKTAPPAKKSALPAFDIVRIEQDGSAVIAGRGVPSVQITLMDGENEVAAVDVNENGEWIYLPQTPFGAGDHEFWLKSAPEDVKENSEIVLVNVPESQKDAMVVMVSSATDDVNVLQKPQNGDAAAQSVEISVARYKNGTLFVKGKTDAAGKIFVYLGNKFIDSAQTDDNLTFSLSKKIPLDAQTKYLLRADKVDAQNKVTARAEVPFAVKTGIDSSVRIIKGDNLWDIARSVYGSGFDYIAIYKANKNQIKDPDLIYPEQVFVLPKKAKIKGK